jgi:hypothetical protein
MTEPAATEPPVPVDTGEPEPEPEPSYFTVPPKPQCPDGGCP